MNKIIVGIVIAVVLVGGGYYIGTNKSVAPVTDDHSASDGKAIIVTFPKADDVLIIGNTYDVTWSNYSGSEELTIMLTGGKSSRTIAKVPANSKTYKMLVPLIDANIYRIEIYPAGGRELVGRSAEFTIKASTSPTSDVTSNWKIFIDAKFGYSVKYPNNYIPYKYTPPCGSGLDNANGQNVVFLIDSINLNPKTQYYNDIKENKIIDFDIFINDPEDKCVQGHYSSPAGPGSGGVTYKLLSTENTKINGLNVLKRNYIDDSDFVPDKSLAPFKFSTYRFEKNGTYFTLLYNNGVSSDPQIYKEFFNTFLSTFKFTK